MRLDLCQRASRFYPQHNLQQGDQAFLVRVQKPIVARSPETLGQDVLQDQAQEVGTAEAAHLHCPALTIAVTKSDLPFFAVPFFAAENIIALLVESSRR